MTENRSSRLVLLAISVTVGAAVANRFYVEPLLRVAQDVFGVSDAWAGLLVTTAQIGYVAGLVLLVPWGDVLERRTLVTSLLALSAVAAAGCALAPTFPLFAAALTVLAFLAVTAQILIPLAADLADPAERDRAVGTVTGGLLAGILSARTVSGLLAGLGGYRLVYGFAAALMAALAVLMRLSLPRSPAQGGTRPRALARSAVTLVATEPVLRHRMALGFLQMASFTALWTPLALLLGDPHYGYDTTTIGLFGLVGVAGALTAPAAGRLGDRGHGAFGVTVALVAMVGSWVPLLLGAHSLAGLVLGIALFDAAFQLAHINHQATVFAIAPEARNRLNTAYMVAFFLGGVAGSVAASFAYAAAGWYASCVAGGLFAVVALLVWLAGRRVRLGRVSAGRDGLAR